MLKQIFTLIGAILLFIIFACNDVKAQGNSGGHRNITCVDSTPVCPCVLPNGSCFDIDTPLDNELKLLVLAGLLVGLYKLHSIRTPHVK